MDLPFLVIVAINLVTHSDNNNQKKKYQKWLNKP
jgi:hypothetical protein